MESQDSIAMAAIQEDVATIFVSIELSRSSWVIGLCDRVSAKMSLLKCEPGDVEGVLRLVERRRAKLARALGRPVRVISCFEAGYDGFWLDRALRAAGIDSRVIDPASLQVNRRARRAKTDRLDAQSLLRALMAYERGDHEACALVRVPSPAEEDARRPHRERQRLVRERTQHSNRVKGLLATQGLYDFVPLRADRMAQLAALRGRDGSPLGAHLLSELRRELARLTLIVEQIGALEAARKAALEATGPKEAGLAKIEQLARLKAIGPEFSNVLVREVFYRRFDNRRQLGAYVGLCPSPFNSGAVAREQGISKAGNARARTTMIELAWSWLRYQPDSDLSQWFRERVGDRKGRIKRITVVALARKLLIALWRYLEDGLIPSGANLKS